MSKIRLWWHEQPTLADLCEGHNNNLNLVRMILASSVLISHSWIISLGPQEREPLQASFGITLGTFCVFGFFLISGLLVTQSLFRRHDIAAFIVARTLRIFPGLAVTLLASAFILGPIMTLLPIATYFGDAKTWLFVLRNFTLLSTQRALPGVFEHVPYPNMVNGSLWTLFYEVGCYGALVVLASLGVFRNFRLTFLVMAGVTIALLFGNWYKSSLTVTLSNFENMAPFFVLGSSIFVLRRHIRLCRVVALLALAVTISIAVLTRITQPFLGVFCYAILAFGYRRSRLLAPYNRLGDYSYGIYIYAYPIQQSLIYLFPRMMPVELAVISFAITLCLAILSWHWVERPALGLKTHFSQMLGSGPNKWISLGRGS